MKVGLKELQETLLSEVGSRIVTLGFSSKPSGQSFYAKREFGRLTLHLAFIKHGQSDFDVTTDVSIRFDAVEELVHEDNTKLSPKQKSQTATIGVELGNLSMGKPIRWTVVDSNDVPTVADGIVDLFTKVGLPYLQKYSSYEEVLNLLCSEESGRHCPIFGAKYKKALALAYILKKEDQIEQITTQGELFLKQRNDFGLESFQEFALKILRKRERV